jgi:ferredoxin-NADP reductase
LPGQFAVVRLHPAPSAQLMLRSYSLSSGPNSNFYRVSVKRELNGAASSYIHNELRVGDTLDMSFPRGNFTLQANGRPVALISAGVGATPVIAMLHALANETTPRRVWWLYSARNGHEHPFSKESRELLQSIPGSRGHIFYSQPGPEDHAGVDFDTAGYLTVEMLAKLGVSRDADFYLCGPPVFMQTLRTGLTAWGVPADRIYTEIFGPGESHMPGVIAASSKPPHPPAGTSGQGPRVSFARSGLSVRWSPSFASLLELAEACDVPASWSCRTGVCHQCESGLISGKVDYSPTPLEPAAAGNILMCCSQPNEDVVVDL